MNGAKLRIVVSGWWVCVDFSFSSTSCENSYLAFITETKDRVLLKIKPETQLEKKA